MTINGITLLVFVCMLVVVGIVAYLIGCADENERMSRKFFRTCSNCRSRK